MKLVRKIQLLAGGLLAVILLMSGAVYLEFRAMRAANDEGYRARTLATAYLADANSTLWAKRWGVAQYLALTDPAAREKHVENDRKLSGVFESQMKSMLEQPLTARSRELAKDVLENYTRYDGARTIFFELMGQGKVEEAATHRGKNLSPAGSATNAAIGKLIDTVREDAKENVQARNAELDRLSMTVLAGALMTLVVAAALTFRLVRQLQGRMDLAIRAARQMAELDLESRTQDAVQDEVGDVIRAMEGMRDKLVTVVSNVRQSSDAVATASAEIAQGNQDLSARTESQASALEETAASMEELGSTVKQNADNARQANQLAQSASTVAVQGGEVVAQVVDTMKGINDSSKKIADIISVIDGIAFQTNILALNAAVEAARAGEQGRGFAVVASEVRNLASRSAEAAKEIKTLITESVERVGHGTTLVDQAGATMSEVVASIRRVTDIMGEISAASAEQSSGVAQVGEAVTQMDQATQQNAALVEEMAAAAGSLKGQSQELVQAAAVFKLAQGAVGLRAPAAPRVSAPAPSRTAVALHPAAATPARAGNTGGEWEDF